MSSEPKGSVQRSQSVIEQRSIEYIPLRERHGKPWHVTPVWIACSANLSSLAIGALGILSGLDLLWSLIAIAVGALFGTFFAAFHASQGPQLGLPQMIQSRPQYGYYGANLIYLIAIFAYIGVSVFAIILMGDTIELIFGISSDIGMVLATVVSVIVAAIGYDIVHKVTRWVTVAFIVVFGILAVAAPLVLPLPALSFDGSGFSLTAFIFQASAMAAATLAWAPYVSDYTRYLPHLSVRASFFGTYVGMTVAAIWTAGLAAVIVAAFPELDIISAFFQGSDAVFQGFGAVVLSVASIGTIILIAMNCYGGSLTVISIIDSIRPIKTSARLRVMLTAALGLLSLLIAMQASQSFVTSFGNFLTLLFYALAPWTATNLIDFFFVRRGKYSVREIFNPRGLYGLWNWRGYTAYVLALIAMAPFAMTAWWQGPVAAGLGYDLAPFVGMVVASIAYMLLARSMDLESERRRIASADLDLEQDRFGAGPLLDEGTEEVHRSEPSSSQMEETQDRS